MIEGLDSIGLHHNLTGLKDWLSGILWAVSFLWGCLLFQLQLKQLLLQDNRNELNIMFQALRALALIAITWFMLI